MRICFDLGPIFERHSTDVQNAYALKSTMDCLIEINVSYLRLARQRVPRLYDSGVRYGRTEIWDSIPALYKRRFGDCKSLTAALVAEYREQGKEALPAFRFVRHTDGTCLFHILAKLPNRDGLERKLFEDPSRRLGMTQHELSYFQG